MCNNWPDYLISVWNALGGLIGNTVLICGGSGYVDECYSLTSEKATLVTHMSVGRSGATSLVLNANTLWVTGGYNVIFLASTEYITMTGTMPGPDLPMALENHAMVAINSTCTIVIGGFDGISNYASTFFYDRNEGEWITGPSLMQARYWHAAGIVTDEVTDEHIIAVVGGFGFIAVAGGYGSGYSLDSTEMLQDGEWNQGKINNATCHFQFFLTFS